mgnify:CR=1 FL=1
MKLKKYMWVVEWVAVALLMCLAIFAVIKEELYLYMFSLLFIIFGLFRIIPLIKTTESKLVKIFISIETVVDLVVGILILLATIYDWNFVKGTSLLGILIGGVIYLRGFIYFLGTTVKDEPSDFMGFITNIALITIATVIICKGGFNTTILSWMLFVIIFIICVIFSIKGYKGFKSYRGSIVGESKIKKIKSKEKKEPKEKKMPTSDEIKNDIIIDKENNITEKKDEINV